MRLIDFFRACHEYFVLAAPVIVWTFVVCVWLYAMLPAVGRLLVLLATAVFTYG